MSVNTNPAFNILIVDDEPINIQLLGNVLKESDYDVQFATSGEEALEWVNSEPFDLILLDLMMPTMDGYEVCERIKNNSATNAIPILFLSASVSAKKINKGFEAGAADFINKPFNRVELLAKVKTHLELKRSLEQSADLQKKLDEALKEIERLNIQR
ncbi:response regulator [Desulfococcaceae bacterium HSG9]|nr:response regulator [Desulfococcaceae bacterium HSG9]